VPATDRRPTAEVNLRPRKTPRQTRAVETRARILDAARGVFATHGYAAGTTNRIAGAAGLSVGSLYQYFPNKDAILVELVREHIEEGTREVLAGIEHAGDPPRDGPDAVAALVSAVVRALVGIHAGDPRLHRVLFEESPRPPSLLADLHRIEDSVVDLVAARLDAAYPDDRDHELPARVVVVTIESLVHRLVATGRQVDEERVIAEITRLVGAYLATLDTAC
jgi:AcrR family transcriptional regulator